jgi:uncharacterized membrane protein
MRRSDWVWLGAILSTALLLRLINLNSGLWFDEIVTLVEFVRLPVTELLTTLTSLNNHLFYSLQAKASIAVLGESAWALRLPAVLFGVASIAALWWIARRLVTASEANMAALLMAVSYHHVWFSQNARGYTGLMFWALVGAALFIEGISRPSWRVWTVYSCVIAAAGYTHLSAVFFFAVHGVLYAALLGWQFHVGKRVSDFKPLAGFALGAVLIVLLHAPMLPELYHNVTSMGIPASAASQPAPTEWKNPVWTVLEILRNLQGLGVIATIGLPVVLILTAVGAWSLSRRHPLFVAIFLTHIPLTLVFLLLLSFRIWPRYFFIDFGFIFLCIVHGVFVLSAHLAQSVRVLNAWRTKTEMLGLFASMTAVLCSLLLLSPNYRFPKQDFLGALKFVEAARAPEDTVAAIGLAGYAFSKYYAPKWQAVGSWREVERLRSTSARTWLVYTSELQIAADNPEVLKRVESEFELMARLPGTLGDGAVFVYRSRAPGDRKQFF